MALDVPTGKGSSSLVDILLGIVAETKGEQFHQFACIIFIWCILPAFCEIKVEEHSRVAGNAKQNVVEGVKSMAAHKLVLDNHTHIVIFATHLAETAGEYTMPEQGHFFQ